jgi:hypothetical protein
MRTTLFLLFLLLLSESAMSIRINEIMAAPLADDSLNEWIEIYNDETAAVDLSGWMIGDSSDNDSLEGGLYGGSGTILNSGSYAIITDDATRVYNNFNVSSSALKLYIDDSSIGNGLSNSGETIYLYSADTSLKDSINYSSTEKGKTWAFINGSWFEAEPTPGYNNNGTITPPEETGSTCDFLVSIISNQTFFNSSNEFYFKIKISRLSGNKSNITLFRQILDEYYNVEESYDNLTPEVINSKTYTYSPNLEPGTYIVEAEISPQCNDSDSENNKDTKMLVIRSGIQQDEPAVSIDDIYDLGSDNKAKYGQTIRVKVNLYRGNSTKEVVDLWAEINGERISKETKTNLYEQYSNYTLTMPLQLESNCNENYPAGTASLFLEGFDKQAAYAVDIAGITSSMCEYIKVTSSSPSSSTAAKKGITYELTSIPDVVFAGKEFESEVKITNNDNSTHMLQVWSYVYKGSKCYSGDRESNKIVISLEPNSSVTKRLKNTVEEAESGVYSFKVKILKDSLKTPYEITEDIAVESQKTAEESSNSTLNSTSGQGIPAALQTALASGITGAAVVNNITLKLSMLPDSEKIYESTTLKARSLVPYLFIITMLLLISYLLMGKL